MHAMLLMNFKAAALKKAAERKRPYGDVRISQPDDITCASGDILAHECTIDYLLFINLDPLRGVLHEQCHPTLGH